MEINPPSVQQPQAVQPTVFVEAPRVADPTPQPKVIAMGLGGAITTLVLLILSNYGFEASPEVAGALATIIGVSLGYITSND